MSNIKFYTASHTERPVRLLESTRKFAEESLFGKYGKDAWDNSYCIEIPEEELAGLSTYGKYDKCIRTIAQKAPLRYCEGELVSGSANLGMAITHQVPVTSGNKAVYSSVSHLTVGFARVLTLGIDGIEAEIDEEISKTTDATEQEVLNSLKNTAQSLRVYHQRYVEYLKTVAPENAELLKNVPLKPATSFAEAVQSLWFAFSFIRLCGNWPGIGRIDEMLGGYLKEDIAKGRITIEKAREYLAHFFIKGCEWIRPDAPVGSGDAQHYQNLVLSGCSENSADITNEMTYLTLDIVEELPIGDFPITVRINKNTDKRLLTKIAEVVRHGGGVVAVYDEDTVMKAMSSYIYGEEEVKNFANDGCWEVQIPGRTMFSYMPFDSLRILLETTLGIGGEHKKYSSYEEIYSTYINNIKNTVAAMDKSIIDGWTYEKDGKRYRHDLFPCSVVGLFEQDCIKNHRGYHGGGTKYTIVSPHIGGAPDAANSLYAIKKLVFDDKITDYDTLLTALENNWEGYETLRLYAAGKYAYYGNDNDECDGIFASLMNDYAAAARSCDKYGIIGFPPGASTFGRQIEWAPYRSAAPFGVKKGEILSGNNSPTPGYELEGATAVICSYCKADLTKQTTGAALDVKLHPNAADGQEGIDAIVALLQGFCELGGFFMQIDTADAETLRQAQLHPEQYRTLSVRVSGWNARFITLNKEWQEMVIERIEGKRA